MNQFIFDIAVMLDNTQWSTLLHESYYMYNWVESTHVLTLVLCLGMLFLIDLRMLGYAFPGVPASSIADRLNMPMLIGFIVMFITGILLFYAVPVRTSQSVWFRFKMVLLVAAAVNAFMFHKRMNESVSTWDNDAKAPSAVRMGAILSLTFWSIIVIFGRFIAYDWFDCEYTDAGSLSQLLSGCINGQAQF
ncbi:MAG: hypothetical protein HOF74_05290 [Gammaproteobacteria bacterium]|jgi:uncharacterized membrane protein|nr:hypothetical protein [Gammaproteobacteria bacterium]MBT3859224.1 hypothetical protein [Gammaproteobacteria bacterium]MBT4254546.1 hypothetical protein [Gammaproteobacteria bacterium]MBT4583023.1 hypothetical protein [Gammaproteobacteria bacterium]MBT4658820.1 hypothetical protein [Gammaproteobacteria bacterium]